MSAKCDAANGARHVAFADGASCDDAFSFERAFMFFDQWTIDAAGGT